MLLQRTTHLSLLHNNRQILRRILVKCLKACMLLLYLHYTKFAYQKNLIPALQSIFCKSISENTECLRKSKPKIIANLLPKAFLIAVSLFVTSITLPSAFLHLHEPLNLYQLYALKQLLFMLIFTHVKILIGFIDTLIFNGINFV